MRTKTKTLILAMTAALMASGAVHAQKDPADGIAPAGPSTGGPSLGAALTGQTCSGNGGTDCSIAIPDSPGGPVFSSFDIANCTTIVDANVGINATHTWVGDLIFTVTAPGGGTSVTVIDRPGTPPTLFGCSGEDIAAILNDQAATPVEDECAAVFPLPTIDGVFIPNNPLSAFNGELGNGTWSIEVSDNAGGDTGTLNDWSLDLVCLNQADLSITKTAPATVVAGTMMTYTVEVSNAGPANAVDAIVTDVLPAGTTYVSDTDTCVQAPADTLTCSLGGIASGASASFDITVAVDPALPTGTVLTNPASVTSATDDNFAPNNDTTADTIVERVAVSTVTKTQISADPIVAGSGPSNLCYNINVANAGPSVVTGLATLDTGDVYPGIVGVGISDWVDNLAPGADVNHVKCFTVLSGAPEGLFTNTATITGSLGLEDLGPPGGHISAVVTPITRVATLVLTKVETSLAPIVAGSGINNLTHLVTVQNIGPSDISGLMISDDLVVPAGVVDPTYIPADGIFAAGTWTLDLPALGDSTLAVTGTVTLLAEEGIDVIIDTATVSGSAGGETLLGDNAAVETSSIRWPEAIFNVDKLYSGGTGPGVPVELVCTDATGLGVGAPDSGLTDTTLVWRRFDQTTPTSCTVIETVPDGWFESQRSADCDIAAAADGGVYNCTVFNSETIARFNVTKEFSDGNTADVDVTLTCDTGLPLIQTLTIAGEDPTGVTFVVKDYVDGTMSCEVTEVFSEGVEGGYYFDDCSWSNVNSIDSPFACVLMNEARPATFTVYKEWEIFNTGGDFIIEDVQITIYCNNEIENGYWNGSYFYKSGILGDGEYMTAVVDTTLRSASCWAYEAQQPSGVETTGNCGQRTILAGQSDSCTFLNTVFFEGIPTLSQYGLAILALLMLGVGMVGFRRFV